MRAAPPLVLAAVSAVLVTLVACANGTTTTFDEGDDEGDAGGRTLVPVDSGVSPPEEDAASPTKKDSGTSTPKDSGAADTGTTTPPSTANDCTGTTSSQLGDTYENACDAYYFNTFGDGNPCTPGGNDCAALSTSTLTFCCYKPLPTSGSGYCYDDYGGQAQCLPK